MPQGDAVEAARCSLPWRPTGVARKRRPSSTDIQRENETPSLRAFADEYLRRSDPHWEPSGRRTVCIYRKGRILPAFGRMPLDRIGSEEVAAWFDAASRASRAQPIASSKYCAR